MRSPRCHSTGRTINGLSSISLRWWGWGQPGQLEKGSLSAHARFALAGHLTRNGRDPEGLEKILRSYFNVPVKIVENVPQWMPLSERERARLQGGRHAPRLGQSAFLGGSGTRCVP